MSVLLETSCGNIVIDLYVNLCPKTSYNFIKLCKYKYYNNVLFFDVQKNLWLQTGDPTGSGKGGQSIWGLTSGKKYFDDEISPELKFDRKGLVCMASHGKNLNGSQFFITMRDSDLEYLEGTKTIFGEIAEGFDETLSIINDSHVDEEGRPFRDFRILHCHILIDPFEDEPGLDFTSVASPQRSKPEDEIVDERIGYNEEVDVFKNMNEEEINKKLESSEAKSRAVVLEMVGDIPDADMKPPENVLFVCKLNPATQEDDLEIIFSRFGDIKSCEIIRDQETGDSLQYAFIEFATEQQCQEAYFKMNNVLIDDRRIKVDFSQSVSKLWNANATKSRGMQPRRQPAKAPSNYHTSRDRHNTQRHSSRKYDRSYSPRRRSRSPKAHSHRDHKSSSHHRSSGHHKSDRHRSRSPHRRHRDRRSRSRSPKKSRHHHSSSRHDRDRQSSSRR